MEIQHVIWCMQQKQGKQIISYLIFTNNLVFLANDIKTNGYTPKVDHSGLQLFAFLLHGTTIFTLSISLNSFGRQK